MQRFAKAFVSLVLAAALLFPAARADTVGKTTDNLRLRKEPSLTAEILATSKKGDCVAITQTNPIKNDDGAWYAVLYNGKEGYMSAEFLETLNDGSDLSETGYINTADVRFRVQPNTECDILKVFSKGTKLTVTGTENGWYCVTYDGTDGYVRCDLVTLGNDGFSVTAPAAPSSSGGAVTRDYSLALNSLDAVAAEGTQRLLVETALQYLGKPYKYGASGPNSFDCSGFTSFVYKKMGYTIQRSSRDQYRLTGNAVNKAELLPGDLVFFRTTSKSTVTHAGIYVGDGRFVHASSGSGKSVVVSTLNSGYYYERYVGAKRVI